MSWILKGFLGVLGVGILGTASLAGVVYNNSLNQPSPPPRVIFEDYDNSPKYSPVPTQSKLPKQVDTDPIVTCTFTTLPSLELKQSECKSMVDCQIGDKFYYYKSNADCDRDQEAYIKGQIKSPTYAAPSMAPINIAPPSLAPYSVAPFPSVKPPSVNIQAPASPKTAPYGYGNFN